MKRCRKEDLYRTNVTHEQTHNHQQPIRSDCRPLATYAACRTQNIQNSKACRTSTADGEHAEHPEDMDERENVQHTEATNATLPTSRKPDSYSQP